MLNSQIPRYWPSIYPLTTSKAGITPLLKIFELEGGDRGWTSPPKMNLSGQRKNQHGLTMAISTSPIIYVWVTLILVAESGTQPKRYK